MFPRLIEVFLELVMQSVRQVISNGIPRLGVRIHVQ
jgi:hypothetical protein